MKYTRFGELFRIYRIKHGETLKDASSFLGVTNSFISSVELGKKKVPNNWVELIASHYNLNKEEINELKEAVEESKNSIKVNLSNSNAFQRDLAMVFQRSFENISEETANTIIDILNGGNNNGLQDKKNIKE